MPNTDTIEGLRKLLNATPHLLGMSTYLHLLEARVGDRSRRSRRDISSLFSCGLNEYAQYMGKVAFVAEPADLKYAEGLLGKLKDAYSNALRSIKE